MCLANDMKINHFDVLLDKETNKAYIGGEILKGVIEIGVSEKVKVARLIIRLNGCIQTRWKNKISDIMYESNEQILNDFIDLTRLLVEHCDENYDLMNGLHRIRFQIPLPLDLISSIEKENYGWVRYTCSATIDVLDVEAKELCAERNFTVHSLLNLDAPYMRESTSNKEESEIYSCCFKKSIGMRSAEMVVADMGLLPGETAHITLTLENTSKRKLRRKHQNIPNNCCLISLCQQLDFLAQNRYELHMFDRKSLTIVVESIVTCETSGEGFQTKHIDFPVPADLQPTSIKDNGLITINR